MTPTMALPTVDTITPDRILEQPAAARVDRLATRLERLACAKWPAGLTGLGPMLTSWWVLAADRARWRDKAQQLAPAFNDAHDRVTFLEAERTALLEVLQIAEAGLHYALGHGIAPQPTAQACQEQAQAALEARGFKLRETEGRPRKLTPIERAIDQATGYDRHPDYRGVR